MSFESQFSKSFLKNIMKKQCKNDVEIISTAVSYIVQPGENFCCDLLKVVVTYSEKKRDTVQSKSMIVKILLENELVRQLNKEMGLFDCELNVYSQILPMINKLEYKKKVAPKIYYTSTDSKTMIIMEDLSELNFQMGNRQEGLNLEHCLVAVERLAYFHASSLVLYEKNPKIMDRCNKGILSNTEAFNKFLLLSFEETLNTCKREPSLQKYCEKINENIKEKMLKPIQRDPKFNVLNHGDFWCNNLMFQCNADGSVKDVVFVDFQLSVFASPFYDLHYFIATSINLEVQENHINNVLRHYYDALIKNTKKFKIKTTIPNWKDFEKDFGNKAYIGFTSMCIAVPIIKANKRKDATVPSFMENGEEGSFRHHCFTNSNYIRNVKFLLPFYDNLKVFDN